MLRRVERARPRYETGGRSFLAVVDFQRASAAGGAEIGCRYAKTLHSRGGRPIICGLSLTQVLVQKRAKSWGGMLDFGCCMHGAGLGEIRLVAKNCGLTRGFWVQGLGFRVQVMG